MKCIILCAGYATRLYPLTLDKPKALLPINNVPLLNYIIERLKDIKEIDEILVVTNSKFYFHFVWWLEHLNLGDEIKNKIEIINDGTNEETGRLEGIGDLNFVMRSKNIKDDVFVILGDNYFNFNLSGFVDFYKEKGETCIGVYDIKNRENAKRFGILELGDGGEIISFEEKPKNPKTTLASVGLYIFSKADLRYVEEYIKAGYGKRGIGFLVKYLVEMKKVHPYKFEGWWFDIGSKEE